MRKTIIGCLILVGCFSSVSAAKKSHRPQVKTVEAKDSVWPKVTIKIEVDASPLESVAIFLALDHQKEYLPNILKSDVIKIINPKEIHTEYELDLPWPLENSKYVHGSILKKQNDCYRVDWYLVRSNTADDVSGHSSFCPKKDGKTQMYYEIHVKPKGFFARFFKGVMIEDTTEGITTIVDYIEFCKRYKPQLLHKYTGFIKDSLKGVSVYKDLLKQ